MKKIITLLLVLVGYLSAQASSINYWTLISASQAETNGEQVIKVNACKYYELNIAALTSYLQTAPMERSSNSPLVLALPMPDGTSQEFAMVESPVMELGLQVKYPSIKTYAGQSLSDPTATIRIDITESGFHAMVLSSEESVFIDPLNFSTNHAYMVYNKSDAINSHQHICNVGSDDLTKNLVPINVERNANNPNNSVLRNAGDTLRTYRLALACTGEYANYFPGTPTKLSTLGHMVTSVNRVVGIYEKELSIHLNLIANNDTLINLNSATDPYDNSVPDSLLIQNQRTCNIKVGFGNYDIGHVFSTAGGGLAGLGVVCNIGQKARGETGTNSPTGDPFDVDYVAHEMGHQFGANHPFNGTTSSCGGGNRNNSTAYESGSGSTIMAYAGICSAGTTVDDIQLHSDAYFHTISFDEIRNYTTNTGATGNTCAVKTITGNHPPVITSIGGSAYTIPLSTPFVLSGAVATDQDGDPLTYCWEEFDLGSACLANSPSGNSPSFRSLNPSTSTSRTFPRQTIINANYPTVFPSPYKTAEVLPSYARTMKFRLTVRDNRSGGGGVTYNPGFVTLTVNGTAGPFLVTQPNTNVTWVGLSMQNITWDVASTDLSPIAVSTVNILLSVDGGLTYPYTLATGVANNGLASVQLPNVTSTTARIKVESVGNIFFDISNVNFTITAVIGLNENSLSFETVNVYPNPSTGEFTISWAGKYNGTIDLKVVDIQGRVVFAQKIVKQNGGFIHTIQLDRAAKGVYTLEANTTEGRIIQKLIVQ